MSSNRMVLIVGSVAATLWSCSDNPVSTPSDFVGTWTGDDGNRLVLGEGGPAIFMQRGSSSSFDVTGTGEWSVNSDDGMMDLRVDSGFLHFQEFRWRSGTLARWRYVLAGDLLILSYTHEEEEDFIVSYLRRLDSSVRLYPSTDGLQE